MAEELSIEKSFFEPPKEEIFLAVCEVAEITKASRLRPGETVRPTVFRVEWRNLERVERANRAYEFRPSNADSSIWRRHLLPALKKVGHTVRDYRDLLALQGKVFRIKLATINFGEMEDEFGEKRTIIARNVPLPIERPTDQEIEEAKARYEALVAGEGEEITEISDEEKRREYEDRMFIMIAENLTERAAISAAEEEPVITKDPDLLAKIRDGSILQRLLDSGKVKLDERGRIKKVEG